MLDIGSLLNPVDDSSPTGENLEYADVDELSRLATGNPGTYDLKTQEQVGVVEPDWRQVRDKAIALFLRTKDLRVATHLTFALLKTEGLVGLASGLGLVEALLDTYWDSLYPLLDRDENDDPIERLNVLASLVDAEKAIPMLRAAVIAESREAGRFTLRDLDLAKGRLPPRADVQPPSIYQIVRAWNSGNVQDNQARRSATQEALRAVKSISRLFQERSGQSPGLDALQKILFQLGEFYATLEGAEEAHETGQVGSEPASDGENMPAEPKAATAKGGALASRSDAVRMLRQVSDFLKRTEPSNPAAMFIDRAIRVADMDFAGIVLELMPDSRDRIEMLGGVSLERTDS